MKIDLMELADHFEPIKIVREIYRQNPNIIFPLDLDVLAKAVGISSIDYHETNSFEGVLAANPEKSHGIITVNSTSILSRQRFTIAHEIGHYLIPNHDGKIECSSADLRAFHSADAGLKIEAEANVFAAELLMPEADYVFQIKRKDEIWLEEIQEFSKHYHTSFEATINRYLDICPNPVAVVFSRNGVVRYPRRNDGFPSLAVSKGSPLPMGAKSASLNEEEHYTDVIPVPSYNWLAQRKNAWNLYSEVYEQTYYQSNGYQVTLLQVEEIDEDEDLEELEESWTPRFRR